jgi:hypothetical protein
MPWRHPGIGLVLGVVGAGAGCGLVGDFSKYTIGNGGAGAGGTAGAPTGGATGSGAGGTGATGGGAGSGGTPCTPTETTETQCEDDQDNDCDELTDCADQDCVTLGESLGCDYQGLTCGPLARLCADSLDCDNEQKDEYETDVDCGGPTATCETRCGTGKACKAPTDCVSGVCTGQWCQAPACGDGVVNGTEECDDGDDDELWDGCAPGCVAEAPHLLISELQDDPVEHSFVEIYNPTEQEMDLSHYYLSNRADYFKRTQGKLTLGVSGFIARFPDGAKISAHGFVAVAVPSGAQWESPKPSYDLVLDPTIPNMVGEWGTAPRIAKDNGMIILFFWDGKSALVADVDYISYGDGKTVVDKTGETVGTETYLDDTPKASQKIAKTAPANKSIYRCDTVELSEKKPGNGSDGDDQTSEDLTTVFKESDPPTPGNVPKVLAPCLE